MTISFLVHHVLRLGAFNAEDDFATLPPLHTNEKEGLMPAASVIQLRKHEACAVLQQSTIQVHHRKQKKLIVKRKHTSGFKVACYPSRTSPMLTEMGLFQDYNLHSHNQRGRDYCCQGDVRLLMFPIATATAEAIASSRW